MRIRVGTKEDRATSISIEGQVFEVKNGYADVPSAFEHICKAHGYQPVASEALVIHSPEEEAEIRRQIQEADDAREAARLGQEKADAEEEEKQSKSGKGKR